MEHHPEIFAPYETLIEIEILGLRYLVPENNSILRCLQYLDMENISHADLCWNGDCLDCQVWIENGEKEKAVIACRTRPSKDTRIVRISETLNFEPKGPR